MDLTNRQKKLRENAIREIEKNKEKLIEFFVLSKRPVPINFLTFFMAGSPGGGQNRVF